MYTIVRGVFAERVSDWSYFWSQLSHLPTLTSQGIRLRFKVNVAHDTNLSSA